MVSVPCSKLPSVSSVSLGCATGAKRIIIYGAFCATWHSEDLEFLGKPASKQVTTWVGKSAGAVRVDLSRHDMHRSILCDDSCSYGSK